jgi:hypothetical protein
VKISCKFFSGYAYVGINQEAARCIPILVAVKDCSENRRIIKKEGDSETL